MNPDDEMRPYLRPTEQVLWTGQPDPTVIFAASDLFMVPFSLMWGGFAIFWEASVLRSGGTLFFALWGIPFVLMGLYMIVGRFAYKRRRKERTAYAVTDQRAMTLVNGTTLTDTPLKNQPMTVKKSRDGSHATVLIGNGLGSWRGAEMYANTGMDFFARNVSGPFGLFDVAQPDRMLHAIEQSRA